MKRHLGMFGLMFCVAAGCNPISIDSSVSPQPPLPPETVAADKKLPPQTDPTGGTDPKVTRAFDGTREIPPSLCGTGSYVSFAGITPDPTVPLAPGAPMTIQARVQYSLPPGTEDAIGLVIWSGDADAFEPLYETPLANYTPIGSDATGGCGFVDLTLEYTVVGATTFTVSIVSANTGYPVDAVIFYRFEDVPYIRLTGMSPAPSQLLAPDGLTGSVSISLAWDMMAHEVEPRVQYVAFDPVSFNYSFGSLDFPEFSTTSAGAGTYTFPYALESRFCHQELLVLFSIDDLTTGFSSDLAAAFWYFQPVPFALSNDLYGDPLFAQPGAGPQAGFLYVENCTSEDQTLQLASDATWFTFAETSVVVPGGELAFVEYAVDATGLSPYSEHTATLTAASAGGDSALMKVDLWVGDYYVPCVPEIRLYDSYDYITASPGAPSGIHYLEVENCSLVDQTLTASSNVSWLSVSSSPFVVYTNDYIYLEYAIDATGLTPSDVEFGVLSLSSQETGSIFQATVELTVGDYYVPPPHYTATAVPYNWNTAADTGSGALALGTGQDDATYTLALPFPILFYGVSHSNLYICENGGIQFTPSFCPYYLSFPDVDVGPALAVNWGDLLVGVGASIRYATTGSTPDRKLVISFNGVGLWPSSEFPSTFQAVFSEGSDTILVQYGALGSQELGGTNFGDGYEFTGWTPASNSAFLVAP